MRKCGVRKSSESGWREKGRGEIEGEREGKVEGEEWGEREWSVR